MEYFSTKILLLPAVILAFVTNGFVTAYVATKLGDPTSRIKGKLTLSPRAHVDIVGMLFFVITTFGWTKALEVNPRYFKNPKRDSVITVLSGSFANFILAFFAYIVTEILVTMSLGTFWEPLIYISQSIVSMNIWLGLFCLLPIPPLNGFLILDKLLPAKYFRVLDFLQQYGFILLILLSITRLTHTIIYPFYSFIYSAIMYAVNFLFNIF